LPPGGVEGVADGDMNVVVGVDVSRVAAHHQFLAGTLISMRTW
jgi:hypothetical protein